MYCSHDFDEDILKTQLQIFSKSFPLKEQLFIIDIENFFKEMAPSSRKLLSEVGNFLSHEHLNHCMIFPTHKEEVDKLNLKKLATDFVLNVPKRNTFFAVPE